MDLRLPEIRRRWDAECSTARLAIGVLTSFIVGASIFSLTAQIGAEKFDCYAVCLRAAMFVLIGYGSVRVAASVGEERRQGTWDLMRLTPLSSFEIALGKLLGAPLYPVILTAALIPWMIIGAHLSPEAASQRCLPVLVEFACMTFGCWALALLVSALTDERLGNSEGTRFVLLVLIGPLVAATLSRVSKTLSVHGEPPFIQLQTFVYYGWTVSCWSFDAISWLLFGAWAFEAARWRIGVDKLEPLSSWRITAFIIFLFAYFYGWPSQAGSQTPIIFPYIAVLLASLAEPWSAGQWRLWWSKAGPQRLTQAPVWMRGAATFVLVSIVYAFLSSADGDLEGVIGKRYPILLCLFALRDIFFLQWCRLKVRKNPEIVAVVYIALAYGLPVMITGVSHQGRLNYLFSAMTNKDVGFVVNVLPGLVQAALAAYFMASAARDLPAFAAARMPDRPIK
jgi:hypothetical protein